MNNSLSFDSFTVPLAQMHVDEDTSELKSCKIYKKSNVQNMEEGNQECTDIKTYRILEQYPTTTRVFNNCMELPEFFESRPQVQPDFPDDV